MKISGNVHTPTTEILDLEDGPFEIVSDSELRACRTPNVKLKYTELPPKSTLEECVETCKFPHMKFPFKYFNPLQSAYFPESCKTDNVVVCGATSAGKTTIAEMTIAHTLEEMRRTEPNAIAAYISPLKALASEKETDWKDPEHAFYKYNISILTGDYILTDARKKELAEADIVCMSSEMMGSRIRRNKTEKNAWINNIRAIIIDEAHLLTVGDRGPNLEVAIMKFTKVNPNCRVIFLSATMPNVDDLGNWLTKLNNKKTTIVKSDYRPVSLVWNFHPFESSFSYTNTEENKIKLGLQIINSYYNDKFIAFVHSKNTGRKLLKICKDAGIAVEFYSADVSKDKRAALEKSFKSKDPGSIRVLISTSSLAWGINMPARRVLIVGLHRGLNLVESLDIIQMGGRAGRVGLDSAGDVHVLVNENKLIQERNFCKQMKPVTSQIATVPSLAFHIVSEIAEGTVYDYKTAYNWYQRSLAHHQNLFLISKLDWSSAENLIEDVLNRLVGCGAVRKDLTTGDLKVSAIGRVASWFYFNPFDVSDWANNFKKILAYNKPTLADIAWALGNTATAKEDYGLKRLPDTIKKIEYDLTDNQVSMSDSVRKHVLSIYYLLSGKDAEIVELRNTMSVYRMDGARIGQALPLLGNIGRYFKGLPSEDLLLEIPYRLQYGMGNRGMELLVLPGVGVKTAKQLMYNRKIYSCKELVAAQEMGHKVFTDNKWEKLAPVAKEISRIGHIQYLKNQSKYKKG